MALGNFYFPIQTNAFGMFISAVISNASLQDMYSRSRKKKNFCSCIALNVRYLNCHIMTSNLQSFGDVYASLNPENLACLGQFTIIDIIQFIVHILECFLVHEGLFSGRYTALQAWLGFAEVLKQGFFSTK